MAKKLTTKQAEKMIGKMGGMPVAKKGGDDMQRAYKKAEKEGKLGIGFGGEPTAAQDKAFLKKEKLSAKKVMKKKK